MSVGEVTATATCARCTWAETWTNRQAAQAAAVWHVYEAHPEEFKVVVGDRPPKDPKPETFGSRL